MYCSWHFGRSSEAIVSSIAELLVMVSFFRNAFKEWGNGREIRDVKAAVKKQWRMRQTVKCTIIMFDTFSKADLLHSIYFLADSFFMLDAPNWAFPGVVVLFSLASESSTSL